MNGQDWTPVTIRKHKTKKELIKSGQTTVQKKIDGGSNIQQKQDKNLYKLDGDEITAPLVCTKELSLTIQQARLAKKMTQKDLDRACCFSPNTIANYEKGTAIINQNYLDKMSKILGVILKKPKKIST